MAHSINDIRGWRLRKGGIAIAYLALLLWRGEDPKAPEWIPTGDGIGVRRNPAAFESVDWFPTWERWPNPEFLVKLPARFSHDEKELYMKTFAWQLKPFDTAALSHANIVTDKMAAHVNKLTRVAA